jgi:hypothetical protein
MARGLAKEVEGAGKVRAGSCFVVAKGTNNNGLGEKVKPAKQPGGAINPGVEVGLDALFKFEEA